MRGFRCAVVGASLAALVGWLALSTIPAVLAQDPPLELPPGAEADEDQEDGVETRRREVGQASAELGEGGVVEPRVGVVQGPLPGDGAHDSQMRVPDRGDWATVAEGAALVERALPLGNGAAPARRARSRRGGVAR